ncbi:MAG: hypothetical protein E7D63_06345 [Staphylococcus epidermidis]|nr:hypothetical protein [Staphylococcus epidermidis]
MYHHIQMYLEQLGYDIVEVILLFEKVDQNHVYTSTYTIRSL